MSTKLIATVLFGVAGRVAQKMEIENQNRKSKPEGEVKSKMRNDNQSLTKL